VALAASGCGAVKKVTSGDPSNGKTLFVANCGSCHTLADAKTQGTVGPNLDDAFSSDKTQGFSIQTMTDVVRGQIAYPDPENAMPANLVNGQDADDVSVYVAKCSGVPNCGVTAAKPSPSSTTTTAGTTTTTPTPSGGGNAQGKQVFESAGCGGCHTLKDAGTSGNVGPNLDTLKPSKDTVAKQVTNGGGGMPPFKGQLSPAQIDAVAAYVSSVSGK
jgi:mono/diheme cytochrome c family protein